MAQPCGPPWHVTGIALPFLFYPGISPINFRLHLYYSSEINKLMGMMSRVTFQLTVCIHVHEIIAMHAVA
jgi:hypothetical protein